MHKIGARSSIDTLDLMEMLFDQISICNAVLDIPGGPIIISHPIIMGLLYFLLELKLFEVVEGNVAGAVFPVTTAVLMLESKACNQRGTLMLGFCVPIFILLGLQMPDKTTSHLNTLINVSRWLRA